MILSQSRDGEYGFILVIMVDHVYPFRKFLVSYIVPFSLSYFLNIDILFIARNSIMCAEKT